MRRFFSLIPWLFLTLSISPLLVWAYLGFFTRYLADDYSTSFMLLDKGFWAAQAFWYQSWSGRYSFTFLVSLVELLGVKIVPWLPVIALSAWFLSVFWALQQIFRTLAIPVEKKWLGVLSGAILFGAIKSLPAYTEVIFWQTGILTYQISNILFALCLALFLKRFFSQPENPSVAIWEYLIAFIIVLVMGGFSETWIVLQVAMLTLGLLYFAFFYKDHNRTDILRILLVAYVASWCAFIAIVKSPGNLGRTTRMTGVSLQSIAEALMASIKDVPTFLVEWVSNNTALVFALFLTGLVAGFFVLRSSENDQVKQRAHLIVGLCLLAIAAGLLSVGFFPAFVVWGMRPVDRAVFIPIFIFVWAYILFGFFLGRFLNVYVKSEKMRTYGQVFLVFVLTLVMLGVQGRVAFSSLQLAPALQVYARLWDERDAFLRQASLQDKGNIVLPSLRHHPALHDIRDTIWITGELLEDHRNWVNQLAAAYYGVESISGK